jgi:hypothetical protein
VDSGSPCVGDRASGAGTELGVLADQGAVEIGGEGLDARREVGREDQPCVAWTT